MIQPQAVKGKNKKKKFDETKTVVAEPTGESLLRRCGTEPEHREVNQHVRRMTISAGGGRQKLHAAGLDGCFLAASKILEVLRRLNCSLFNSLSMKLWSTRTGFKPIFHQIASKRVEMFKKIKTFNEFISRFITMIFSISGDVHSNYCPLPGQSGNRKKRKFRPWKDSAQ